MNNQWFDEVTSHEYIKKFLLDNKITSKKIILDNKFIIDNFLLNYKECNLKEECNQVIKYKQSFLTFMGNIIYIASRECVHYIQEFSNEIYKKNIIETEYTLDKKQYDFSKIEKSYKIEQNLNGLKILDSFKINLNFIKNKNNQKTSGAYIYGKTGVGKTYLLKHLAIKAAEEGFKVILTTILKIDEKIKSTFNKSGDFDSQYQIIDRLKKVDILFLDDLAVGNQSEWLRDNILFNIINYRLENNLLTYITSNYASKNLLSKFTVDKDQNLDKELIINNVMRFIERLEKLCNPIEFKGVSKRI